MGGLRGICAHSNRTCYTPACSYVYSCKCSRNEGLGPEARRMATSQAAMMTPSGGIRGCNNVALSCPM